MLTPTLGCLKWLCLIVNTYPPMSKYRAIFDYNKDPPLSPTLALHISTIFITVLSEVITYSIWVTHNGLEMWVGQSLPWGCKNVHPAARLTTMKPDILVLSGYVSFQWFQYRHCVLEMKQSLVIGCNSPSIDTLKNVQKYKYWCTGKLQYNVYTNTRICWEAANLHTWVMISMILNIEANVVSYLVRLKC